MKFHIDTMNSCSLEPTTLRRDLPPDFIPEDGGNPHDETTLWYDALWKDGYVIAICPTLFNLQKTIEQARFRIDDEETPLARIDVRNQHSYLYFKAPRRPKRLSVELDGRWLSSGISERDDTFLKGLNTVFLLQKNNDPLWIEEFFTYHRKVHGLEACVMVDNGSTDYGFDALERAAQKAGLARMKVLSAKQSHGKPGRYADGRPNYLTSSLQSAVLNSARLRFLGAARAVLQCDIDELVWSKRGSIFDAVRRHPVGYLRLEVSWRYAKTGADQVPRHRDHIWRRPVQDLCSPKYCLRPSSLYARTVWQLHGLERRRGQRLLQPTWAGIWHCRQVTTNWNVSMDRKTLPPDVFEDAEGSTSIKAHLSG